MSFNIFKGNIALAKEMTRIPVHVLIRPRCGNFNYTIEEGRQIIRDIEYGLSLGADGFVVGALRYILLTKVLRLIKIYTSYNFEINY